MARTLCLHWNKWRGSPSGSVQIITGIWGINHVTKEESREWQRLSILTVTNRWQHENHFLTGDASNRSNQTQMRDHSLRQSDICYLTDLMIITLPPATTAEHLRHLWEQTGCRTILSTIAHMTLRATVWRESGGERHQTEMIYHFVL